MARGDRIIVGAGISVGALIPQAEPNFRQTSGGGFDCGERTWLTHPDTPRSNWPQRGQPDAVYTQMFVTEVLDRQDASGMIELTACYRGLVAAKVQSLELTCDAQTVVFGPPLTALQIPIPTVTRIRVVTTEPDYTGVGGSAVESFLSTGLGNFSCGTLDITNVILNGITGWILETRTWSKDLIPIWETRERFIYKYLLVA
ncbi:MAG: hypothetical protein QOE70_4387 [Chthoniobacter sp.]|jgi:hypothetical protein|nr:hypothetical protein [Chthoniobacter sp.]